MANHAHVTRAKIKITPKMVSEVIDSLNKGRFENALTIEYSKHPNDPSKWGPHVWLLTTKSNQKRVCWINKDGTFEMRHGGGDDFIWWIDNSIVNEVALRCKGMVSDDADGKRRKPDPEKYLLSPMQKLRRECPEYDNEKYEEILTWAEKALNAQVLWEDTFVNGKGEKHQSERMAHWILVDKYGFIGLDRFNKKEQQKAARRTAALFIYLFCKGVSAMLGDSLAQCYGAELARYEERHGTSGTETGSGETAETAEH